MTQDNQWRLPGFRRQATLFRLLGMLKSDVEIPSQIHLEGLGHRVAIEWDAQAVPAIRAESLLDAVRAQGYLHGRMRGFQMDILRRMPAGEMSELLGPGALAYDTFMRRLNLKHWAEESMSGWSPLVQQIIAAYTDGVNQAWTQGPAAPEYKFLKAKPRPWTARDSSVITYFLSWALNSIWTQKWAYYQLSGDEAQTWLFGDLPDAPDTTIIPGTGAPRMAWAPSGIGSNNWVVSGALTEDGQPLLANDPHLMPQLPSIWYQIAVKGGPLDVAGVSLPGAPGVVIGQNRHIAWGVTNVDPDCQELYHIHMQDDRHYLLDGELTPLTELVETIRVRGGDDVLLPCEDSHAGPIIHREPDGTRIAMDWTGFRPITTVNALINLNLAQDWNGFLGALEGWTVPAQNFVYADADGHIGYVLGGLIPTRHSGPVLGCADGNTRESLWTGSIPWSEMPRLLDPEAGYIVTANNAPMGCDGRPRFVTRDSLGYRAHRITTLLNETGAHNTASFSRIQLDIFSPPLLQLAKKLLADPNLPDAWRPVLEAFDGEADMDSAAPTLLYLWAQEAVPESVRSELSRAFFFDVAPGDPGTHPFPENFWGLMGERLMPMVLSEFEQLDRTSAFARADARGRQHFGPRPADWTWGRAHQVVLFHPFIQVSATKPVFGRAPVPAPGDFYTPRQAAFAVDPTLGWPRTVLYLPSYRQVLKPGHPELSQFIHLTGQAGHPLSSHYDDLIADHLQGRLAPIGPAVKETALTPTP